MLGCPKYPRPRLERRRVNPSHDARRKVEMTLSIKSRRSLGWTGWMAAIAAATMAVLLVSAAVAQATVTLSPVGPYSQRGESHRHRQPGCAQNSHALLRRPVQPQRDPGDALQPGHGEHAAADRDTRENRVRDHAAEQIHRLRLHHDDEAGHVHDLQRQNRGPVRGRRVVLRQPPAGRPVQLGASTTNISFR